MKINQVRNNTNNQNFKGLGTKAVDGMVKVQDTILKAGFAATFVAQDFLGSELPRILTGLTRNSDKTGQLNYKFASMEACRELLTGPPIFALPFVAFALGQKKLGGTIKSPVTVIEAFSDKLSNVVTQNAGSTPEQFKKAFYGSAWNDALKNTCGKDYAPQKETIEKLTSLMTELETSKNYTLKDKFNKVPKFRTSKDIVSDITGIVTDELKANADAKGSFSRVVYKDGLGKKAQSSVGEFVDHMSRFAKDSMKHIGEDLSDSKAVLGKLKKFRNKIIGSRVAANFAIMAAAILYATQVPKLYKSLNKTNPGLIGLTEDTVVTENPVAQKPVDYQAFNKLKENRNQPSFKGLGLGKLSQTVQKNGTFRKVANAFEFHGADMGLATLVSVLTFGIVTPRVLNSYDKHDRREILTRDILTLSALVVGAKALQKTIVRGFEKMTGMALSEKTPNYFKQSKPKRIFDHLRPFGGVQVFSNSDISLKYSNIDKFKGGVAGFCEFVSKTGGNLVKLFANDKDTKTNMEKMLGKALNKSSEAEIIKAVKKKENAEYLNKIVEVFKKPDNTFIKKAKSVTGVFGFVSTFVAVPAFMIFLQKFNEKITKNAIAKENEEKKIAEQKFTAIKLSTDMMQPDASKLYMN